MYRIKEIQTAFADLLGWRQGYLTNELIDDSLTITQSGEYYQDQHPYLTLENIKAIMPDYSQTIFPTWDIDTLYKKGSIAKSGGINYEALQDNTATDPAANTDSWKVFSPLSNYLRTKTDAAVMKTVQNFVQQKMADATAKDIMENRILFDGIGSFTNTVANSGKTVGLEIGAIKGKGLTAKVERVGLQFDTNGALTLYLYHSSQINPLESVNLVYSKSRGMQWFALGWDLPYVSAKVDAGGYYYVSYDQGAAPGLAINKDRNWLSPCVTCGDYSTFQLYSQFMNISPFNVSQPGPEMWDVQQNRYDYNSNYGLNLAITIYCDYTDFFVEQKDSFKSVLGKEMAMLLLREIAYNPNSRVNRNESTVSREQLIYEIDGDTRGRNTGISAEYKQAMKAVQLTTQGMSKICLPCKGNGVKYRTV